MNLKGKNILLLCPNFYIYRNIIVEQLEQKGAHIIFYENKMLPEDWRCSTTPVISCVKYLLNPNSKKNYINNILDSIKNIDIDILFCINGFCVTKDLINILKQRNCKLVTTLFLWDSLTYWKYSNILEWFDYKFSFDHHDCKAYKNKGLKYYPDFFINSEPLKEMKYDVVHIGSISIFSIDRIKILSEIYKECNEKGLNSYIKIVTKLPKRLKEHNIKTIILFIFNRRYRKLFYYLHKYRKDPIFLDKPLDLKTVNEIESSSKIIIDIPPTKQNGATIRSLEAINRGQKLLTTNKSILLDKFYSPNNIGIIDKNKKNKIDCNFIDKETDKFDINYLYISNWLDYILCKE